MLVACPLRATPKHVVGVRGQPKARDVIPDWLLVHRDAEDGLAATGAVSWRQDARAEVAGADLDWQAVDDIVAMELARKGVGDDADVVREGSEDTAAAQDRKKTNIKWPTMQMSRR